MFRLLKLTDLVRFNTKIEMIQGGLTDFHSEMLSLHEKYLKRAEATFVSWIKMTTDLDTTN